LHDQVGDHQRGGVNHELGDVATESVGAAGWHSHFVHGGLRHGSQATPLKIKQMIDVHSSAGYWPSSRTVEPRNRPNFPPFSPVTQATLCPDRLSLDPSPHTREAGQPARTR